MSRSLVMSTNPRVKCGKRSSARLTLRAKRLRRSSIKSIPWHMCVHGFPLEGTKYVGVDADENADITWMRAVFASCDIM